MGISTMLASAGAAVWRILTQPIQNVKTLMQVEGAAGIGIMVSKMNTDGVGALWEGAFGTMGATWLGHYPWYVLVYIAPHCRLYCIVTAFLLDASHIANHAGCADSAHFSGS